MGTVGKAAKNPVRRVDIRNQRLELLQHGAKIGPHKPGIHIAHDIVVVIRFEDWHDNANEIPLRGDGACHVGGRCVTTVAAVQKNEEWKFPVAVIIARQKDRHLRRRVLVPCILCVKRGRHFGEFDGELVARCQFRCRIVCKDAARQQQREKQEVNGDLMIG